MYLTPAPDATPASPRWWRSVPQAGNQRFGNRRRPKAAHTYPALNLLAGIRFVTWTPARACNNSHQPKAWVPAAFDDL